MHSQNIGTTEPEITVPCFNIKPPGSSFLEEKLPSLQLDSGHSSIFNLEYLLEEFKMKTHSYPCSPKKQSPQKQAPQSFPPPLKRSLKAVLGQYNSNSICPGEMKKSSEDLADILTLAHKILAFYNINLVIDAQVKSGRVLFNALKEIVLEVCLYPVEFFVKLQIKELFFFDENSDYSSSTKRDACFYLGPSILHKSVLNQLYQIMLERILSQNINITEDWNQLNKRNESFKETFLLLMKNKGISSSKKEDLENLKKVLSKSYPEISEEWIKTRSEEKRKMMKVRFCLDLNC